MKQKLLFSLFAFLVSIATYADPPLVTMTPQNVTVCPGNSATITITGPASSFVTISTPNIAPYSTTIAIGVAGTATFTTPRIYEQTTFTLESLRTSTVPFQTYNYTGISVTVNVIPNGCTTIATNSTGNNSFVSCNPGECHTLNASFPAIPSTTSYEVTSIPYCPQAPFTDSSYTTVNAEGDDIWSAPIALPFNFSFFNNNFTSCQVGTNGVITFNPQAFPGFCNYGINNMNIPNPAFPHTNAIFGPFQDSETRSATGQAPPEVSVNYTLTGTYPCRKLIVNFYHLGQFQCNQTVGLQTSQIVLYEVSNIIEVYVQNRTRCAEWQDGDGVIGIMNPSGTMAFVPPGRNTNDAWVATNEAWRFTPNGPSVAATIRWIENASGTAIATTPTAAVCPAQTTTYHAEVMYNISGVPFTISSAVNTVYVSEDLAQSPADITVCHEASGIYTTDLTTNNAVMLGALNPADYEIAYFMSQSDAELWLDPIPDPAHYTFFNNQILYAGIMPVVYDCWYVKPFELSIIGPVNAPTGISPQTLYAGQTLADIEVNGTNIQWYDAEQGGNQLPITTPVQNGVTYYATQSVANCESRSTQSLRLAVIVQVSLGTSEFDRNTFTIYPNPAADLLTISSSISDVKLEVFNSLSQKMESKTLSNGSNTINLGNFASGVYLFQLSLDGKTQTYKVVKN